MRTELYLCCVMRLISVRLGGVECAGHSTFNTSPKSATKNRSCRRVGYFHTGQNYENSSLTACQSQLYCTGFMENLSLQQMVENLSLQQIVENLSLEQDKLFIDSFILRENLSSYTRIMENLS